MAAPRVRDIDEAMAEFTGKPLALLKSKVHVRSESFERFVAWQVIRHRHLERFLRSDVDAVVTGATHDNQIDTLLVLVNGEPVYTAEEAQRFVDNEPIESLSFVFIQATLTPSFNQNKMNASVMGICNFFRHTSAFDENLQLQERRRILQILTCTKRQAPPDIQTWFYFAALGNGMDESHRHQRERARSFRDLAETTIKDRLDSWLRDETAFALPPDWGGVNRPYAELINLKKLRNLMRRNDGTEVDAEPDDVEPLVLRREIAAPHLVDMPSIPHMKRGFIGFVEGRVYLDLLESEDGMGLLEELSSANVRRFMGHDNPVNKEIAQTLEGPDRNEFLVRNNGVTIVARDAELRDGRLALEDYQIVNGLQTSHILYNHRDRVRQCDDVFVALKVIVTDHGPLARAVSRSTNRQTDITDLQAESSSQYVLRLAAAFDATRRDRPGLWLQRRAGEHEDAVSPADVPRVIELDELVRAAGAALRGQPHVAADNPAQLRAQIPTRIFNDEHRPAVYVVVGAVLHRVREFLASPPGQGVEARFRFHLVCGLYEIVRRAGVPADLSDPAWDTMAPEVLARLEHPTTQEAMSAVAGSLRDQLRKFDLTSLRGRRIHREAKAFTLPFMQSVRDKLTRFSWGPAA